MNVTNISFLFYPNGDIIFQSWKEGELECAKRGRQSIDDYSELKKLISSRFKKSETNSTDTPIFGERITLELHSDVKSEGLKIGFYCHKLSPEFKEVRKEILKRIDRLDYY